MVGHVSTTLASLLVATVLVCGACSAVPDLHFDVSDGGTGSGSEGGVDPSCQRTGPEICGDGIDNDCDGRTDCQDKDCSESGYSCQSAPQGWTFVRFAAASHPDCRSSDTSIDLQVASGDGAASCSCTCTGVGGSCATGELAVIIATSGACTVAPSKSVPANTPSCTPLVGSIVVGLGASAKVIPSAPTACTAQGAVAGALTNGRLCQPKSSGGAGGCGDQQVCVQRSGGGLDGCITKAGRNDCPGGYDQRSTAGTSANDSRACNGCTCEAPAPCVGATVSLYSSGSCKTSGSFSGAENIDSTCRITTDDDFTATFFKSSPPTGGCGAPSSTGTATGSVSFADERTVCCRGNN